VSLPLQIGQASATPASLGWLDGLGALVWLLGFAFEAIGDAQLRAFKADPTNRGKVMDRGLWRYTRHPNYFGDALLWWGLFLIASHTEHGLWTVVSPVIMTFLLTRISGVPMLERQLKKTRPGYEEYCRRTSAFFPWPPRTPP
jgi:steroid 5-alpha reductase family enzyme